MSILSLLTDVLFVGHSLVGPDLPPMVEAGLRARGLDATVQAQVINGAPLQYQWDNGATAEGVDARARLASGDVDVLVLTEALPLANHVQYSDSAGQVARWAGAAWDANPQTQVFLYETWHSLRSGSGEAIPDDDGGAVPWADRLTDDLPVWQSLTDAANAARPDGTPPVRLIPAGQAMGRLAAAAAAGQVPGAAGIADFFDDDIHLNGRGLYFVALVQIATITGEPPDGLPAKLARQWRDRRSVVSDDMAAALQHIAGAAVTSYRSAEEARLANPPAAPPPPVVPTVVPAPVAPAEALPVVAMTGPPQADPAIAALGGVTDPNLSLNLAGVNDWSTQLPFLNLMKTARPWIAHRPGQWGGWEFEDLRAGGQIDAAGWPRRLPPGATGMTTLVLTDLPEDTAGVAGRYVLTWTGTAKLRLEGRIDRVEAGAQSMAFDYTPGPGSVILTLTEIDPGDPPRDLVLVRQDRQAALAAGNIFNPDWLSRIRGVRGLRFMDWMATNNSTLSRAADRPRPGDFTWAHRGVPVEVLVALANELQADPWFCIPHLAEDALVREMAQVVRDGLAPGLRAHVEYSNEVWNWQFGQAHWAEAKGRARWGQDSTWMQFYALRASEVAAIWTDVFGADAATRLVRVISSQTGWLGLEDQVFNAPLVVAEGRPAPATGFDAYAVTGYFAAGLGTPEKAPVLRGWLAESLQAAEAEADRNGLTGGAREAWLAQHRFDLATARSAAELEAGLVTGQTDDTILTLLSVTLPHHARAARAAGLDLVMYEGGSHLVGVGMVVDDTALAEFYAWMNTSPEMGALYVRLRAGWAALTDAPFNAFLDVEPASKWGSWGALRHLGDDTPRWRALARGCASC